MKCASFSDVTYPPPPARIENTFLKSIGWYKCPPTFLRGSRFAAYIAVAATARICQDIGNN
jgi:hypothetical protein